MTRANRRQLKPRPHRQHAPFMTGWLIPQPPKSVAGGITEERDHSRAKYSRVSVPRNQGPVQESPGRTRAGRAGIRDPMTLMTRPCVRILTLTGLTTKEESKDTDEEEDKKGGGRRGGDASQRDRGLLREGNGGNKRLLEASGGRERGPWQRVLSR